jgi:hypothetical protein
MDGDGDDDFVVVFGGPMDEEHVSSESDGR